MLSSAKLAMIQAMLAAPMASDFLDNPKLKRMITKSNVQTYVPKMVTASDKEIADWNAKVEAKRKAKKSRR